MNCTTRAAGDNRGEREDLTAVSMMPLATDFIQLRDLTIRKCLGDE